MLTAVAVAVAVVRFLTALHVHQVASRRQEAKQEESHCSAVQYVECEGLILSYVQFCPRQGKGLASTRVGGLVPTILFIPSPSLPLSLSLSRTYTYCSDMTTRTTRSTTVDSVPLWAFRLPVQCHIHYHVGSSGRNRVSGAREAQESTNSVSD